MIKIIETLKKAFIVYDKYRENGYRLSSEMIIHALMLVSSAAVGFGLIPVNFHESDIVAAGTAIYAMVSMVARMQSKGGQIALKEDRSKPNKDEHTRGLGNG